LRNRNNRRRPEPARDLGGLLIAVAVIVVVLALLWAAVHTMSTAAPLAAVRSG